MRMCFFEFLNENSVRRAGAGSNAYTLLLTNVRQEVKCYSWIVARSIGNGMGVPAVAL